MAADHAGKRSIVGRPKEPQRLSDRANAGVRICFGTDAGVSKHGRNADEFEWMVKYGMPAAQAIKAATVNNAELLGLAN